MQATAGYWTVVAAAGGRVRARECLLRAVRRHFRRASIILEFCFVLFLQHFIQCVYNVLYAWIQS